MQLNSKLWDVFKKKPFVLGMLHLAGEDPVARAIEEIEIYQSEGVDGVIVENYHAFPREDKDIVEKTLDAISSSNPAITMGINILPNEVDPAFNLAQIYGAKFIQLDHISGKYARNQTLYRETYLEHKQENPEVIVMGGVWPKYYEPVPGSALVTDLQIGMQRAEVLVVTGRGTGQETPLDKINLFGKTIDPHPMVIGAGLNPQNAYEQLTSRSNTVGCIVGSCFKPDKNTREKVDSNLVQEFMQEVHKARDYHKSNY